MFRDYKYSSTYMYQYLRTIQLVYNTFKFRGIVHLSSLNVLHFKFLQNYWKEFDQT